MKKQIFSDIRKSFAYSGKRCFLDGPLFMFLVISSICVISFLAIFLFSIFYKYSSGARDFTLFCVGQMNYFKNLYDSNPKEEYLQNYQFYLLIVENRLSEGETFVSGAKAHLNILPDLTRSRYSQFISLLPFSMLLICPYLGWQLFFSNDNKSYYKNVISTHVSKDGFLLGKIIFYFVYSLLLYLFFYLVGFAFLDGKSVLLFKDGVWSLSSLVEVCAKRIPFGLLSCLAFASFSLLVGSLFKNTMDFLLYGGVLFAGLFITGLITNLFTGNIDYVLSISENICANTSISSILTRLFEGLIVTISSISIFYIRERKKL